MPDEQTNDVCFVTAHVCLLARACRGHAGRTNQWQQCCTICKKQIENQIGMKTFVLHANSDSSMHAIIQMPHNFGLLGCPNLECVWQTMSMRDYSFATVFLTVGFSDDSDVGRWLSATCSSLASSLFLWFFFLFIMTSRTTIQASPTALTPALLALRPSSPMVPMQMRLMMMLPICPLSFRDKRSTRWHFWWLIQSRMNPIAVNTTTTFYLRQSCVTVTDLAYHSML